METVRAEVNLPRNELEVVRAENQRLHIVLGNSESEKELLKEELLKVRSQLETERADREEFEAKLSPAKAKFCSGRHPFGEVGTRRSHNS
jgi:chromosome segregation ATPase